MQSKVSVRGQTVIPREIRKALGIHPKQKLEWAVRGGTAVVYPMPDDPIKATRGLAKRLGMHFSTEDLLKERRKELELEEWLDSR